ncbi:MAG: N-acetylmuramoyl-L-alanine amidase [Longimicrobiales bacterium]|nr:N-acetylmuramoyl-L-alanine amidase [Longimicrobiales bacterium]
MSSHRPVLLVALGLALAPAPGAAQDRGELRVRRGDDERPVAVTTARGFAAVAVPELGSVGWTVALTGVGAVLRGPAGELVELRDGTPFVTWGGGVLQLADAPYFEGGDLFVPLQIVSDLFPSKLPETYSFDPAGMLLTWEVEADSAETPAGPAPPVSADTAVGAAPGERAGGGARRVVVIDAGHGGEDPGTISRTGVQEKTVALGIARALAEELRGEEGLDVFMIRDGDVLVPIWDRGARGTALKGEHPGIFVSIHANSAASPGSTARGFETYFLSEARTEHERRVAAIENAPTGVEASSESSGRDLDFILRELKNLDQQHWSSLLAEMVQQEVARIHPGPDRGVKQAPLAVITNAIMPAVLVEIGYLSHPDEARLLGQTAFQREAGRAIAEAARRFLRRYPPGAGSGVGEGR